ncbi:hypothetical protein PFUGPA_01933 [Plasmodium falciparum Palo Alto/Uganda]|uniref:Uncharacterized protein n=1 Tax=Plasmodium falciparum (isolate Palo Alto / Uganda) TaxID=57270 RepID=W4J0U0_PLAFP|nr:hypothetical protein PFUGPA_01933 [Plasmodium falciparum Palo Alto/Uganda]
MNVFYFMYLQCVCIIMHHSVKKYMKAQSISKLHIIEEMLEELSYEPTQNEDVFISKSKIT